jgi:saccharopine dehydrogenase-like NADP-dependent oxidoreductase
MKKVLILGAGMVVNPMVQYLLKKNIQITIASNTKDRADKMIGSHPNGKSIDWDANDIASLDKMVGEHDLTVSLLPYAFHPTVAKICIKHKKNMVTTSYVKSEMKALDEDAKKAGIIILNESGLDPGIDHMSAMKIIDHIHAKNGKVESFYSLCGALPAPEAANNPFKYKFSWSPKGVVMAGNNDGKFLKNGKIIEVPTENLFRNPFTIDFPDVDKLEVYPNRDSLAYKEIYSIPEAETIYRGTFRYKGWCEALDIMKKLKLIVYDKYNLKGKTYADLIAMLIGSENSTDIRKKVATYLNINVNSHALDAIEWLGLFDNKPMNRTEDSPFEITSDLMINKMQLGNDERDMVAMQHTFVASYPDGKKEVIKSSMLDFGTLNTDTAIARTVALPAAIGVEMILENKISVKGVHVPVIKEIYLPILENLENLGIKMKEEFGLPLTEAIK